MGGLQRLQELRKIIVKSDQEIIAKLAKRFIVTKEIQILKSKLDIAVEQKEREKELLETHGTLADRLGLPEAAIKKLFAGVFSYSKKTGIIGRTKKPLWKRKKKMRNR